MRVLFSALALLLSSASLASAQEQAATPATPLPKSPDTPAAGEPRPHYEPVYEHRVFQGTHDATLAYGWLAPLHADPTRKYPLVICLPGSGGNVKASAVLARPEMREKFPSFVMVGEIERPFEWAAIDTLEHPGTTHRTPEKLPVLLEAVHALIRTEAIDPTCIYITGQSLGGIGSWAAIARDPGLFAAAAPVCGE